MKKNIFTERAEIAFRNYARLGLAGCESILDVICRLRGMCRDSSLLDMLAVFDTLRLLELSGDKDSVCAVKEVYFATAKSRIKVNVISYRIRRLACELHIDDRTVYRRLQKARKLWVLLRSNEKEQTAGDRGLLTELLNKL